MLLPAYVDIGLELVRGIERYFEHLRSRKETTRITPAGFVEVQSSIIRGTSHDKRKQVFQTILPRFRHSKLVVALFTNVSTYRSQFTLNCAVEARNTESFGNRYNRDRILFQAVKNRSKILNTKRQKCKLSVEKRFDFHCSLFVRDENIIILNIE